MMRSYTAQLTLTGETRDVKLHERGLLPRWTDEDALGKYVVRMPI
jgi:hypothetical protein